MATSAKAGSQEQGGGLMGFLRALEIDLRLLGMLLALVVVWIVLNLLTNGVFLTPRNLWNLAVQSSVTAIVATGMVFVIVMRHIDLSVGSVLGFAGMSMAFMQARVFPTDAPWNWIVVLILGLALGAAIGAFQGYWIAYQKIPSFVVTLAGLLMFGGFNWLLASGQTIAPLNSTFKLIGGGIDGSIGFLWSWIVGAIAVAGILFTAYRARTKRAALGFPVRPLWAELLVTGAAVVFVVVFVQIMNSYNRPRTDIPQGIPIPVLILITVALGMTAVARLTKFGRYVYAMGGSPEAAELAGINTKQMTLYVFMLIGVLSALAGSIATARLNAGVTSTGTLAELYVIAAAVIGGTSFAGGVGTILGAVMGAIFMQSLLNGMVLLGYTSALQDVVIGLILILAAWVDIIYRRSSGTGDI